MILKSRAAWTAARRQTLGASDAAAILGVSPWKGALQLYHEKKGTVETPAGETFARELGLLLEDPIAELYRQRTRRVVVRPEPGTFVLKRHPRRKFMTATLDAEQVYNTDEADEHFRNRPGVLEIKTAGIGKAALWTNEPPIDYQVQVQHQMACAEMQVGSCVGLVGGVALLYSDLKRDEEFIALLEAACGEFWRRLELNDPPPPDGTEATREFLKKLYPKDRPVAVTLPPEAIEWDAQRVAAKAEILAAEKRKLEAEARLKLAIGDAVQGNLPNGVVYSWKTVNRTGYVVQPTSFRDFRRRGSKAEKTPTIPKGRAPSIEDVASVFERQQQVEQETADAGDITFD